MHFYLSAKLKRMTVHCLRENLAVTAGFYFYSCTEAVTSAPTTVRISTNHTVIGKDQDNCGFSQSKPDIIMCEHLLIGYLIYLQGILRCNSFFDETRPFCFLCNNREL